MRHNSVYDMVMDYIDALPVGAIFHPRAISEHIFALTAGSRYPLEGSVGRYIRYRKERRHDVKLNNRARSEYIKTVPNVPVPTEDEERTPATTAMLLWHEMDCTLAKEGYPIESVIPKKEFFEYVTKKLEELG